MPLLFVPVKADFFYSQISRLSFSAKVIYVFILLPLKVLLAKFVFLFSTVDPETTYSLVFCDQVKNVALMSYKQNVCGIRREAVARFFRSNFPIRSYTLVRCSVSLS